MSILTPFRMPREFAPNPLHKAHALSHRVPLATVRDNLYVLTDYTFAAVYRVEGMLYDLAGREEMARYVDGLRSVLNTLIPGVQIKFLHRITHNYREQLEDHLAMLDGENTFARYIAFEQAQMYYRMMENRRLLRSDNLVVLSYKVPDHWWNYTKSPRDLFTLALDLSDKSPVVQKPLRRYREMIQRFEEIIRPTVSQLGLSGLAPRRLENQELYELAWEILNPAKSLRNPCPPIRLPDPRDPASGILSSAPARRTIQKKRQYAIVAPESERSQLVQSDWLIRRDHVRQDGKVYAAVSLRMKPTHVYPTMAIRLAALPFEATVSIDCVMLQKQKELEKQWRKVRLAKSMAEAPPIMGGTPDPAVKERAQEAENSYLQLARSTENPFRLRLVVVVSAKNEAELDQRTDAVISLLRDMENAVGQREEFGVDTLIRSTWPFSHITDTHTRKAYTSEVANLLPVFSHWEGSKRPVTLVMDPMNRLVRLDPYPIQALNRNRTVCGKSGSGKSFATQLALVQPHAARANTEVLIVESGDSFGLTTKCFGGVSIRLGPSTDYRINPFDLPPDFDRLSSEEQEMALDYKYKFLTKLVMAMVDLPDRMEIKLAENVLGIVIQRTYMSAKQPRMRDLYRHLGQYINPEDPQAERTAKRIRTLLRNYAITEDGETGIYAHYFDCYTNIDVSAPIITFDLFDVKDTPALLIPLTIVTISGLIYNRIASRDGKERIVIIDEAWALIKENPDGSQTPAGAAIELFWREGRKLGTSCTLISQNYSDMAQDAVGRAIVGNSENALFLAHERQADNERAFQSANFSKEQRDRVYDLRTEIGRFSEIMVREGSGWGVVRLPSPGLRYWLSTTHPQDLEIRKRYEKTYAGGYGLPIEAVVALLAKDYPMGALDAQRSKATEMPEQEAIAFADRFRDRLARFGRLLEAQRAAIARGEDPPRIPFDFR